MECAIDGLRHLRLLFLVVLGEGIEHNEKGEQQGDEIGIGDHPSILADEVLAPLQPHAARSFCFCWGSLRKPASWTSSMRGFMPSRMEITPSSIISRRWWSSRRRRRILPAKGRKKRLAMPTP